MIYIYIYMYVCMPYVPLYGIFTYFHHKLRPNVGKYYMVYMDIIVTDIHLQSYISIETTPTLLGGLRYTEKNGCSKQNRASRFQGWSCLSERSFPHCP